MDLLKILRSFEEFLFEAASWLIFYPLTLWRIVRRPLATMAYSDREQCDTEEGRYDDALSPPLMLLATLIIANIVGAAAHLPPPPEASALSKALFDSPRNLVLFRSLVFCLIPLISAVTLLRRQKTRISREALRAPFYAQCYLSAPVAAFVSIGGVIFQRPDAPNLIGLAALVIGMGWFLSVQTLWFRAKLDLSWANAALTALWAVARALAYLVVILIPVALF